jgi:hypothetical protein
MTFTTILGISELSCSAVEKGLYFATHAGSERTRRECANVKVIFGFDKSFIFINSYSILFIRFYSKS